MRHMVMKESWPKRVLSLLGNFPDKLKVKLTPEQYQEVMQKRWIYSSLHKISFGAIPRSTAALVEHIWGIEHLLGLTFVINGRLMGTSLVAFHKGVPLPFEENLQVLCNIAALTLRRKVMKEEQARMQAALAQAQKMESIGCLAGGVAHDFNNMLGVIVGHAELAMERDTDMDAQTRNDLQEIVQAARRSSELTAQLLAFSRLQAVSPKSIIVDSAIEGNASCAAQLVKIYVSFGPPVPQKLPSGSTPYNWIKLCSISVVNARDAIVSKSEITIATSCVFISPETAATENVSHLAGRKVMKLSVSDTGCGMGSEQLKRIFEPFFTTKAPGHGTGLGLSTVYGIVQKNKGFIQVQFKINVGTTFHLYLPLTEAKTQEDAEKSLPLVGGSETIVFVEDENAILRVGKTILERHGYRVLAFAHPHEALAFLQTHQKAVDLLITDVVMPETTAENC